MKHAQGMDQQWVSHQRIEQDVDGEPLEPIYEILGRTLRSNDAGVR